MMCNASVFNSMLTLASLFLLWEIVPPLFKWAFLDGVWFTGGQACKQAAGACWSIISANLRFILFGFYPQELQWRPLLAMMILFGLLFYSRDRRHWKKSLGYAWIIGLSPWAF
jgi:general L-amino acid transport system permease protein